MNCICAGNHIRKIFARNLLKIKVIKMGRMEHDNVLGKDKEIKFHVIGRAFSRDRFLNNILDFLEIVPSDLEPKETLDISRLTINYISNVGKEYSRQIFQKDSASQEEIQFASTDEIITGSVRHVKKSSFSEGYSHNGVVLVSVKYYGNEPEEYYKIADAVQSVNLRKCKGHDIMRSISSNIY